MTRKDDGRNPACDCQDHHHEPEGTVQREPVYCAGGFRTSKFFVISRAVFYAFVLALLLLLATWFWKQIRPYECSDLAEVTWASGGEPYVCSCEVVDSQGKPVPNALVRFESNSGFVEGMTDDRGRVDVRSGEPEVEAIRVNSAEIMRRPYAGWLGPTVQNGLKVRIVLRKQFRKEEIKR